MTTELDQLIKPLGSLSPDSDSLYTENFEVTSFVSPVPQSSPNAISAVSVSVASSQEELTQKPAILTQSTLLGNSLTVENAFSELIATTSEASFVSSKEGASNEVDYTKFATKTSASIEASVSKLSGRVHLNSASLGNPQGPRDYLLPPEGLKPSVASAKINATFTKPQNTPAPMLAGIGTQRSLGIGSISNAEVFTLSSNPSAPKTIYLDFNGYDTSATAWNDPNVTASADRISSMSVFSLDSTVSTSYSQAELDAIKEIFLRVAADYAPFYVNVTTAAPSTDNITRSTSSDSTYGTVVSIGNVGSQWSGAGGIAYVGIYDLVDTTNYYKPALVFPSRLGGNAKNIAEATSHEAGHNLNLSHDGQGSAEYYTGGGSSPGWAPIMGVGYSKQLTQFSRGQYSNATTTENDFLQIGGEGIGRYVEGTPNTDLASAETINLDSTGYGGIYRDIQLASDDGNTGLDYDYFKFTASFSGSVNISVNNAQIFSKDGSNFIGADLPAGYGNLHLDAQILNASGIILADWNNNASIDVTGLTYSGLIAGQDYFVKVGPNSTLPDQSFGETTWGSLGSYALRIQTGSEPSAPTLAIAATSATQTEGNSGSKAFTFTVTRAVNTTGANDVSWAVTGSGTNPANATDFAGGVLPTGTVSFAVGETSKVINVSVQGDTTVELDENFAVTLSSPTNGATISTATASGTIQNDDVALPVLFYDSFANNNAGWTLGTEWQIGSATVSSGQDSGNPDPGVDNTPTADNGIAGVVIGGNASTSLHDFYYLTSPIINTANVTNLTFEYARWLNSDYTPYMQNTIDIYNGSSWMNLWSTGPAPQISDSSWQPQSFDINAYKNSNMQIRFGVNVGSINAFTVSSWNIDDFKISAIGTILPVITVVVTDASAAETATGITPNPGQFTLTRTGATTSSLTVNVLMSGTATNGTDYTSIPTTATFAIGSTTAVVNLNVIDDTLVEVAETAILTVGTGTGYTVGTTPSATVNITDNETSTASLVTLISNYSGVSENGKTNLVYTFNRTGATTSSLTVNFGVSGTAINGDDYVAYGGAFPTPTQGTITFAVGATTAQLALVTSGDTVKESNETVGLTLTSGSGYQIGTPLAVTTTILNDDGVLNQQGTTGNDVIEAGSTSTLSGKGGNDILIGSSASNILVGGAGNDTLTTGTGFDTVLFTTKTEGIDIITDFNVNQDLIQVSAVNFGGGLIAGESISSAQFSISLGSVTANTRFIFDKPTGKLFFDIDGSGSNSSVQFASLTANLGLTEDNIFAA